jgi:type IV pilus assembly protein PilA
MNNKGFTLVEIIAVIVIIGIVIVLAMPAINGINNGIQSNILDKKIKFIELAGKSYGTDFREQLRSSSLRYEGKNCIVKTVKELAVADYLDKETDSTITDYYIEDPTDKENYLDNNYVIIYFDSTDKSNESEISSKYFLSTEEVLCK